MQPIFNKLLLRVAKDVPYLNRVLAGISDQFTEKLLELTNHCALEGVAQPIQSCISRSDYMLDLYTTEKGTSSLRARQVEINAIASGQSSQSTCATRLHNYILSKYGLDSNNRDGHMYPSNNSNELVATGLVDAYNCYAKSDSYILIVNEPRSFNFCDHVLIEETIRRLRPDIRVVRRCFEMLDKFSLGPNKELLVDNNKEIAVVYFRYGYDISHYSFNYQGSWNLRLLIERSRAIKCPSLNFHLAGVKKFQQVLSKQEDLERFLDNNECKRLTNLFCNLYTLDQTTAEGRKALQVATENYEKLVLKPQREGGGHNFFGDEIPKKLMEVENSELSQFILMDYINSPKEKNWLVRYHDSTQSDAIILETPKYTASEIGIYGSVIGSQGRIISNKSSGYLVRSKDFGAKENGVASGFAGLSSLILIDDTREDLDLREFYEENLSAYNPF